MTTTETATTTTTSIYDSPSSLEAEARAQGIEIKETTTEQLDLEGVSESGDKELGSVSEETNNNDESTNDGSDGGSPNEGQTNENPQENGEDNLQEEVDKHAKAVESLKKNLKDKGVDFNLAVKEYEHTGGLSEETLNSLEKAGYPIEVVESFIEGRKAIEAKFTHAVYDSVGGEKEYQKIVSWASNNLQKKSIDSFNRAIDNNNLDAIVLMLEGMKSKMVAKMGTANKSIHGSAKPHQSQPKGFNSKADIIKAMSDPRYGREAKYTQEVERMMWATNM